MKVLILDSREEDRHALAGIVAARGHSVVSSPSGADALREAASGGFDLVFCGEDKNGPGGPAFVRAFRKIPGTASIPCYAVVKAGCDPEDEKLLFDVGASGVLIKPYDPRTIQKVIDDATPDAGQLALPQASPNSMGDDTFVERYTDRLVETLERKVRDLVRLGRPGGAPTQPEASDPSPAKNEGGTPKGFDDALTAIIGHSSMALAELPEGSRVRAEVESTLAVSRKLAGMPPLGPGVLESSFSCGPAGATVLVADGDHAVLDVICRLLGRAGFKTAAASDGAEAVRILGESPGSVDLVLCAMGMRSAGGVDSLEGILGLRGKAGVLVMAGAGDAGSVGGLKDRGCVGVLFKPFDPGRLFGAVQESLRASGGGRGSKMAARERPRVMVVDDEELILRALERALRREADITGLPAAERAMELLRTDSDFDWIISDLNMPGMSGLDFYQKVLELDPGLAGRFVLLSGGAVDQEQAQAVHNLHIPVFEKPINFEELKAHITKR